LILKDVILDISKQPPGQVVSQIPAPNEWVKPGDEVTLHISGEYAVVPSLIGYTVDEARTLLIASGFPLGDITEQISTQKPGLVIAQTIAEGDLALLDTKIGITISQQQPTTYRAQTAVVVEATQAGVMLSCRIEEAAGEREVLSRELEAGRQEILLNLDTLEPGTHTVRVYLDGALSIEKQIEFVEEE
ncbi:MAG: PASTA domain-containing protein, partial [Christensenellaceae bacterium]|nr:PASTA domain-containing protein [Christensenellaceae bacterium]